MSSILHASRLRHRGNCPLLPVAQWGAQDGGQVGSRPEREIRTAGHECASSGRGSSGCLEVLLCQGKAFKSLCCNFVLENQEQEGLAQAFSQVLPFPGHNQTHPPPPPTMPLITFSCWWQVSLQKAPGEAGAGVLPLGSKGKLECKCISRLILYDFRVGEASWFKKKKKRQKAVDGKCGA